MNKRPHDSASVSALQAVILIALPAVVIALALVTKSFGTGSESALEGRAANHFTLSGVGPNDLTVTSAPTVQSPPTPTPASTCPAVITQSVSQTITPGNSISCNGGSPGFFHSESSYWRAFEITPSSGSKPLFVSSVSFGIQAATANPSVGTQPVSVRLHSQTSGVFPSGTWTQFASNAVNIPNQDGTVFVVPIGADIPLGTTRLIMEVHTPDGGVPVNHSFFIGSNSLGQSAPGYVSAPTCGLSSPTDLATIGFPNMHMVFSVNVACPEPTPPPISPSPTPTAPPATPTPVYICPTVVTQSASQTIVAGSSTSCNNGSPDFFHAASSYWRAFDITPIAPNIWGVITVSFGVETASANPAIGTQPVIVRLHSQTSGVFPAGTWTQFAEKTVNLPNQSGTIFEVTMAQLAPSSMTRLIVEIHTPDGRPPSDNSFVIGSNSAGQSAPGYFSAPSCGLMAPTDLATLGFPNMHMVFNLDLTCVIDDSGTPTPFPLTPTPPPSSPIPTESPSPSPSPTPALSPTATASPVPVTHAVNLSTRMRAGTGENAGIGGFIVTGTGPKNVLLRAIGPSLTQLGVPDALTDPVLRLRVCNGEICVPEATDIVNDNWRDTQDPLPVIKTGIPPTNDLESAFVVTLVPGPYTATITGNGNTSGIALFEIYDLNPTAAASLANLSTRAFVGIGDDVVIAGFMLAGKTGNDHIIVRGLGPSLADAGVANALSDPILQLRDGNGELIIADNNWQDDPDQAAQLVTAGLAPANPLESAISAMLPPGPYTALLAGFNDATGVGLVEIYDNLAAVRPMSPQM